MSETVLNKYAPYMYDLMIELLGLGLHPDSDKEKDLEVLQRRAMYLQYSMTWEEHKDELR